LKSANYLRLPQKHFPHFPEIFFPPPPQNPPSPTIPFSHPLGHHLLPTTATHHQRKNSPDAPYEPSPAGDPTKAVHHQPEIPRTPPTTTDKPINGTHHHWQLFVFAEEPSNSLSRESEGLAGPDLQLGMRAVTVPSFYLDQFSLGFNFLCRLSFLFFLIARTYVELGFGYLLLGFNS
jgi:hypothetical protein